MRNKFYAKLLIRDMRGDRERERVVLLFSPIILKQKSHGFLRERESRSILVRPMMLFHLELCCKGGSKHERKREGGSSRPLFESEKISPQRIWDNFGKGYCESTHDLHKIFCSLEIARQKSRVETSHEVNRNGR